MNRTVANPKRSHRRKSPSRQLSLGSVCAVALSAAIWVAGWWLFAVSAPGGPARLYVVAALDALSFLTGLIGLMLGVIAYQNSGGRTLAVIGVVAGMLMAGLTCVGLVITSTAPN